MAKSHIEWTDWTSNPIGIKGSKANYCIKVSPGCKHCYAEIMSRRLAAISHDKRWLKYNIGVTPEMELRQHVLDEWFKMKKPRKIFVGSMTDIFGDWVKTDWLYQIFHVMEACPHLTFQILTKRPEIMSKFVDGWCHTMQKKSLPKNIWCGTSVENQKYADERIPYLLNTKCMVRFLSCEPLLGPLQLQGYLYYLWDDDTIIRRIHQVIVGGESGFEARLTYPQWVDFIRIQCKKIGIPFFFKQWGNWITQSQLQLMNLPEGEHTFTSRKSIIKDREVFFNVGKGVAGAQLDGVEYKEFPIITERLLANNII